MRIQLLSDLHLEVDPSFTPTPAAGADVLILAGDVGGQGPGDGTGSKCPAHDPYGLVPFSRCGSNPWPVPVLYVPGNHEFDGGELTQIHQDLKQHAQALGITWLDQQVIQWPDHGVRFIGCTLWSDFDALGQTRSITRNLQYREKSFRAADFYLSKTMTTWKSQPFLAEQMRDLALEHQAWLRTALQTPFEGRTIVVTHFAPSLKSADPRYGVTPGTAGFCNFLDEFFEYADLWLHGHLHCSHDYTVQTTRGQCRVVANPLGYFKKNEQNQFTPTLLIDL